MTKFEKFKVAIQNMTVEEFAEKYKEYLSCDDCMYNQVNYTCDCRSCKEGIIKWLESEVEECH